ncbi:SPOR domain-containing protein [Pseudomonas sp. R37(2017)]|uniref:SPOR domain-containing protein n=1 Tax=Pseudomonas sp. R37(2017) TaxID=1981685 RepID=UPI000A1E3667|nr:SPOR domain-containing protein [Pseudomonas sp. R37(2017)]
MSVPMLNKMHMNGYDVLSVNNGPWRVCTQGDRLGSFASREEALAFAASLPGYRARAAKPAGSQQTTL